MRVLINFSTTSRYHESPVERARRSRKIGWSAPADRKSTRLNSSHSQIPYAAFCLNKKSTNCRGLARTDDVEEGPHDQRRGRRQHRRRECEARDAVGSHGASGVEAEPAKPQRPSAK